MEAPNDGYRYADRLAIRSLDIIVVGAGITGLSTALALAKTGHSVIVFECASKLSEIGAGIQIPPNASRILDRLGILQELLQHMSLLSRVSIR
jgi:salicylate hydroxylase